VVIEAVVIEFELNDQLDHGVQMLLNSPYVAARTRRALGDADATCGPAQLADRGHNTPDQVTTTHPAAVAALRHTRQDGNSGERRMQRDADFNVDVTKRSSGTSMLRSSDKRTAERGNERRQAERLGRVARVDQRRTDG
jgi:hypothetical protein